MKDNNDQRQSTQVDYDRSLRSLHELGDFIEYNYEKFAIMGIFGTISVFLLDAWPKSAGSIGARLGTVGSLLIFALASLWIAWRSSAQIGVKTRGADSLDLATFGYAVIFISSLSLSFAVLSAVSEFSQVTRTLGEYIGGIFLSSAYVGIHPSLVSAGDDTGYEVSAYFISIYLVLAVFAQSLIGIGAEILGFSLSVIPLVVVGVVFHFLIYEALQGFSGVANMSFDTTIERIRDTWAVRTSVLISVVSILILTIFAERVAQNAVGQNPGYYSIAGMKWTYFTLTHWFVTASLFSIPIIRRQTSLYLAKLAQILAIIILIASFVEITVIIPNGKVILPL
jgi:hypothetical protein